LLHPKRKIMNKIKILPKQLADKIAAGEVVERPASVVKELIENSLDAESSDIEVIIEDAGRSGIKVIDNGLGISPEDLKLAPLRHATSKIGKAADLTNITTLGFRGEALSSIAAVSFLKISSAAKGYSNAVTLEGAGGVFKDIKESARQQGTTVEIRNLFFNTPARLKFLKSKATETAHITRGVTEFALGYPDIAIRLMNNKQEIINCNPNADLLDRIKVLFGEKLSQDLIPISFESAPLKISGFISKPGHGQLSRRNQYIFVNKRPITNKTIAHAIIEGYHTYIMQRQFPTVFIFIETSPELIDVNVHPTKREIRFRQGAVLHDIFVKLIKDTLADKKYLPRLTIRNTSDYSIAEYENFSKPQQPQLRFETARDNLMESADSLTVRNDFLTGAKNPESASSVVNKYLQANNTYVIFQDVDGLVIIDQHAAHERILFDKLMQGFKDKKIETQKLLLPVTVHLSKEEFILAGELNKLFEDMGFDIENFGEEALAINSYPAVLGEIDIASEFRNIIADLSDFNSKADVEWKLAKILATVACHCAIRAHKELTQNEMASLISSLWQSSSAYTCPHGRPTMIKMKWPELEKKFRRK